MYMYTYERCIDVLHTHVMYIHYIRDKRLLQMAALESVAANTFMQVRTVLHSYNRTF
jgi:hypothetical protein